MAWEIIDFDDVTQQVPFFYFKRFDVVGAAETILTYSPQLPAGYGYLLREIIYRGSGEVPPNGFAGFTQWRIGLIQKLNYTVMQNELYPPDLISTPGHSDSFFAVSPAPVDNTALSLSPSADPATKNKIILNNFYQANEVIEILIQKLETNARAIFDLLFTGYLIPDKKNKLWR